TLHRSTLHRSTLHPLIIFNSPETEKCTKRTNSLGKNRFGSAVIRVMRMRPFLSSGPAALPAPFASRPSKTRFYKAGRETDQNRGPAHPAQACGHCPFLRAGTDSARVYQRFRVYQPEPSLDDGRDLIVSIVPPETRP